MLHQAQISCVVSGLDELTWSAYAFVDTSHDDPEEEDYEQLSDYVNDEGQYHPDALTAGAHSRSRTEVIRTPRDFWLRIVEIRVRQVTDEWHNTVAKVVSDVRDYV
jgi:hypothetical protein